MAAFCVVVDIPINQFLIEEVLVVYQVFMIVNKLFLNGSVIPFDECVDFGTSRVDKQMGNPICFQLLVKFPQIF
jgi:hypothetical protein